MQEYYYYRVFRKTIIQFLELFNDIKIGRYNTSGVLLRNVTVPVRFSPKSKAYIWVAENSRNEEMLPMISVDLQSIDFDPTRMANRHESIQVSKNLENLTAEYYKSAVPYNLTFNVRLWALHMVDVDQIYEQILPFFAPYVFMRIYIPEVDTSIEVKVVLQSCSPEMTDDVSEEEARVIRWSTTFVAHTWLFKPILNPGGDGLGTPLIDKLFTNYYLNKDTFDERDLTVTMEASGHANSTVTDALSGIGFDEDAAIIFSYERYGSFDD